MNEKGFIASALLYGMLALFLVLMTSTLYVMANNKLSMDKLKKQAIEYVKTGRTSVSGCTVGTVMEYGYSGGVQTFKAACTGKYKLEVWGAQGGTIDSKSGGYGGYSYGTVTLNRNDQIYIYVGGQGALGISGGGYNGGGNAQAQSAGGGGATHIATTSGLLASLSSNRTSILIVAGGGGGSGRDTCAIGVGNNGGGYNGVGSVNQGSCQTSGGGGTQTSGGSGGVYSGTYGNVGTFGQGGSAASGSWVGGGGGGGWYGGGSGASAGWSNAGGGGSGYLNTSRLTNYRMYCYDYSGTYTTTTTCTSEHATNCANLGNGYAKITLTSIS